MLPKPNRLNLATEFRFIKRDGKSLQTPFFTILYRPSRQPEIVQVGFIVSNRVGTAVERNRIRRQLREVFHKNLDKFPKGIEIAVIAKKSTLDISYENLNSEVTNLLQKIHI